jgi:hypothetical protein
MDDSLEMTPIVILICILLAYALLECSWMPSGFAVIVTVVLSGGHGERRVKIFAAMDSAFGMSRVPCADLVRHTGGENGGSSV